MADRGPRFRVGCRPVLSSAYFAVLYNRFSLSGGLYMRVLRSSLFVAATAIIAAACGDKVTVPAATTAAPRINSVLVAPSSATISSGQAVTLSAAVNADAGLTTSVAWT